MPGLFTGPLAARLGGVDFGWLVGLAVSAGAYLGLSWNFSPESETEAVEASRRALADQSLS